MRRTVEANDGDAVLHAADQRVEDGIQLPVVVEVTRSGAARLNDDGQRQRLRIGVLIECQILRYAVVGEEEVVSREFKDHLSCLGLHQTGPTPESSARSGLVRRFRSVALVRQRRSRVRNRR